MITNDGENNPLSVENDAVPLNANPFIIDNRLYVSLHALAESVQAQVKYNKIDHTIHLTAKEKQLTFWSGSSIILFNGLRKEVGSPIITREGRTQIPLRYIADLLGWEVTWHGNAIVLIPRSIILPPWMRQK
ncbi:copper amine oxidase N-terminal domain-containing protein [Paenibacillus nasutitermitis]|uniref:Copper amine oxidase-like N-terminal domain-containing protein n=1 Tax=Paenibacillus nasutitermitis TaxID=1652958 RepID=A0A916Z4S0_9BACL|nr:copper amine oxidase N-terminal domain-containing protein [Paenibacillus nasutitermitis]GGD73681.1 hypothetical protein GCM10010911_34420 [Paenibacillus nasutitermitis]